MLSKGTNVIIITNQELDRPQTILQHKYTYLHKFFKTLKFVEVQR